MFDRSLLREAIFEFVVLADTHYMRDPAGKAVEFNSRLKQTRRAETALRMAAALACPFVVHLGDLVQEYPDTEAFPLAMDEAIEQLKRSGITPYHVAGNHDVGDKPDPTMPTRPVTEESLAAHETRFGKSWYSFDHGDCHFIVLNSQIFNTRLPAAALQQRWLEDDLAEQRGRRTFVFLHLPPFLCRQDEPSVGHYDNVGEPARYWLLQLVRKSRAEMLFAAHVHCSFIDRIDDTRYLICNSTSFTRPGFPHMFASAAPPDRGRDDAAKLGFYLLRVFEERTDTHFIRTHGIEQLPPATHPPVRRVITRTTATLPQSPLGVTLRHPLSSVVEIPLAWPSSIRQRVRNDYPLLSCLELGVSAVRVPASDLSDPLQAGRLAILRDEGVGIVATAIWSDALDIGALLHEHQARVDTWELQLAGTAWPSTVQLRQLRECQAGEALISLSAVIPDETIEGKQHPRTRFGFRPDELPELDQRLGAADCAVQRVLCRLGARQHLWQSIERLQRNSPFEWV